MNTVKHSFFVLLTSIELITTNTIFFKFLITYISWNMFLFFISKALVVNLLRVKNVFSTILFNWELFVSTCFTLFCMTNLTFKCPTSHNPHHHNRNSYLNRCLNQEHNLMFRMHPQDNQFQRPPWMGLYMSLSLWWCPCGNMWSYTYSNRSMWSSYHSL